MKILSIDYTLKTKSLDIYISGCKTKCEGCHNPESWDFNKGDEYKHVKQKINSYLNNFKELINNIMIFGGEPLDGNITDLYNILLDLKCLNIPIWLFTSKELNDVPYLIRECCSYIKTGKFINSLKCNNNINFGISLATSNQMIHKI